MAPPFEQEDSDEDSISVTSTRISDVDGDYPVEKINWETDDDGQPLYLVKWEGYPLHTSTWEPAENILGAGILPNWEREKEEIRAGAKEPFDREAYDQLVVDEAIARNERHKRRVAKRRRKGLPSRSGSISNGSAKDVDMRDHAGISEDEPLSVQRKRQKIVVPKRKGVAVKVKKSLNRQAVEASSSNEESSNDDDGNTSEDSLLIRSRNKQRADADQRPPALSSRISKTAAQPTARRVFGNATTPDASPTKQTNTAPPVRQSASAPRVASMTSARDSTAGRSHPSSSARKTALSTAAFGSANAAATKRLPILPTDPKRRLSGKTSITLASKPGPRAAHKMSESDPRHQRFANLSEQNRFHKHVAREAAPDSSVLSTFNPKTGKYEAPAATASRALASTSRTGGGSSASAVPSAFGKRDEPTRGRCRSALRSPPRAPHISTSTSNNVALHKKVCWDWRNSRCTKPGCTFAHYYITCPYWKNGGCRLKEIDCQYDHQPGRDPMAENPRMFPPADQSSKVPLSGQQSLLIQGSNMTPQQTHALPAKPSVAVEQTTTPASNSTHPRMAKPEKRTLLHLSDITCRFWAVGGCFSTNCRLAHRDTGHYIEFKDVTCSFWLDGRRCKREEKDCKFAHRLTEYRAGPPGSEQIVFGPINDVSSVSGSLFPGEVAAHPTSGDPPTNPPGHAGLDDRIITCHYWLTEAGCSRPAGQCRYAHRLSHDRVAPPKGRQWDRILYEPEGTQASHMNRAGVTDASGTQRSLLHKTAAAYTVGGEPMAADENLVSSSNATPITRRQSSAPRLLTEGPAFIHDVTLVVAVDERRFEITVSLACSTEQDRAVLIQGLGSEHRLELNRVLNTRILQIYWDGVTQRAVQFPSGDIVPKSTGSQRLEEKATERLAAFYEKATSCGVVLTSTLTLLVYSANSRDLEFLNRAGDPKPKVTLKFKLLPGLPMAVQDKVTSASTAILDTTATDYTAVSDTDNKIALQHLKSFFGAKMEDLLKISDVRTEDQVFVMLPDLKAAEMKLIAEVFEERFKQPDYKDRDCKVWTSQKPGSWDSLLSHRIKSLLLILHPDVPLWGIPSLGKLLHQSGMRVFSINTESTQTTHGGGSKGLSCERLFPMGDVVFITDDVFTQSPGKVLAIIDEINKGNKHKQLGDTRHRIATRPGIRTWLADLLVSLEGKEDPRLVMLLGRIMDLSSLDKDDEQFPGNPSEAADLISLPPEQLPTFQALQIDRAKATDYIVNWFAGWAFMNASKLRRFTVCHEEPGTGKQAFDENYNIVAKDFEADPRGWGKEFRYMLVKTPDQWLTEAKTKTKSTMKK